VGPTANLDILKNKKKKKEGCLPPPGFDPRTVQPTAQDRTLITSPGSQGTKKKIYIYIYIERERERERERDRAKFTYIYIYLCCSVFICVVLCIVCV